MSMNKQVFWLRGRPTPPALPSRKDSGFMAFRRSLQRRYRAGFAPASLFSRRPPDDGHLKALEKSLSRMEGAPYHARRARVNAAKK